MSLDITPMVSAGRQLIQSYKDGSFTISAASHQGAVIVFAETTIGWPVSSFDELTPDDFKPVIDASSVDVLLMGCGDQMLLVPPAIRQSLKDAGIVIEPMSTGAACRTFNVMVSEDRNVAAALLPVF